MGGTLFIPTLNKRPAQRVSLLCLVLLVSFLLSVRICAADAPPLVSGQMPTLAPLLERVTPAVVNVTATMGGDAASTIDESMIDFRFDFPIEGEPITRSSGSGVIIDAKAGLILTNSHLVQNAGKFVVTLKDRRTYKAALVGVDPGVDIAVLKIDADGLTGLPLGDSDKLRVGDYVVAVGNPFGLGQTVSTGIVSALGLTQLGIEDYEDFIQTDASINPGDSGGALINLRGEVVGINTAIFSLGGGNVGIGFAIAANLAKASMKSLLRNGDIKRGWTGVQIQDLTPALAGVLDIPVREGAIVNQVFKDAPARKAGVRAGDVIIAINGKAVRNAGQFRNEVGMIALGDVARVTALRDGDVVRYNMLVEKEEATAEPELPGTEGYGPLAGARFDAAAGENKGVVIVTLEEESTLAALGLQVGDLIAAINHRPVSDVDSLFATLDGDGPFALHVTRGDSELLLIIQ